MHKVRPQWKLAVALVVLVALVGGILFLRLQKAETPPVHDETARQQLEQRFGVTVKEVVRSENGSSDIFVEDKGAIIELYGVPDDKAITSIAVVPDSSGRLASDVAVVSGTPVKRAIIRLPKDGRVLGIARCDDFDAFTGKCSQWVGTDIPFTDYGKYVEFEVTHFTGYGVIPKTELLYVTDTSNYNSAVATSSLAATQDGTENTALYTVASGNLYGYLNATASSTEARVIRTTDVIRFSSRWTTGSRITAAQATFKLYAGTNGGTLVCQQGNDNTGGVALPAAGTTGTVTGSCSPSSNFTVLPGDSFYYVINVYAQNIAGGGAQATRQITLRWDIAASVTWVNISSVQLVDANLSVNASPVYPGQTINASGVFYFFNASGVPSANVNVTFYNTSNSAVQSRTVTTSASGNFSDTYTIPSGAIPGTWKTNITAQYNATVNATNETTFTVGYYTNAISPANGTQVDRDSANASMPDVIQLTASTSGIPAAGTTLSFYANLTDPVVGGQTDILLGTNTTNSSGQAILWYNPSNTAYAGNYKWWTTGANGLLNESRTFIVMGQLSTAFNNSSDPPATAYYNDTVTFRANVTSLGPETRPQLASLYMSAAGSAQRIITNTSGSTNSSFLTFSDPHWSVSTPLTSLKGVGVWTVNVSSSGSYFFSNSSQRSMTVYGYMNVTSNATTPSSATNLQYMTTACRMQDQHTQYQLQGITVGFYRDSTLLGTNTTNSSGDASYSFKTLTPGPYTITCNVSDQPSAYYYRGDAPAGTNSITVTDGIAPSILNVLNTSATDSFQVTWDTDENANGSVRYGTTTALASGSNSSAAYTLSHDIRFYGLQENTLYYYNVTSCDSSGNCNMTGPYNVTTQPDTVAPSVTLTAPANKSGNGNGTVTFNYTASDSTGIANCSIYLGASLQQTDAAPVDGNFTLSSIAPGTYNWTVACVDSSSQANIANKTRVITVLNASAFPGIDLTSEDMGNVANFTLENSTYGRINFSSGINFSGGADINDNVIIANGSVFVNSTALPMLNRAAQVKMYGLPFQFTPEIEKDGVLCGASCTDISYAGNTLTFNVTGFSNYTSKANTQLNISDQTDTVSRTVNQQIRFYANYTRKNNGAPISGANIFCNFTENSAGGWSTAVNMTYNSTSTLYEYNKSFSSAGTYTFKVTCDGSVSGWEVLTLTDSFTVSPPSGSPAFNGAVNDSSSSTSPTIIGNNVTFSAMATDPEGDQWNLIVCNSTAVSGAACTDATFCQTGYINSGSLTSCQFNTSSSMLENYSWYAFACDNNTICSAYNNVNSPFHVNHQPEITSISVSPASPNASTTLSCTVGINDNDTDTVNLAYRWFLQDEGGGGYSLISGQTASTLGTSNFDSNDNVLCEATPTDEHGLSGYANNSTANNIVPGVLNASAALNVSQVYRTRSALLNVSCTMIDGETAGVTLIVEDNRTGTYSQSSITPAAVYVSQASFSLGAINSTTVQRQVTVYTQTAGNYSFRAQCQAADSAPTIANSTGADLEVVYDTTPPSIGSVQVTDITTGSARVTWSTDDSSDSLVEYGITTALGSSVFDPSDVTSHTVLLISLDANTTYYYNITSCNIDGYCSNSGPFSFNTLPALNLAPPSQKGYCTAAVVEQGPNYRAGYISKGDVVEFYCEAPNDVREREQVEITMLNKNRQMRRGVTSPDKIYGNQVVVYP